MMLSASVAAHIAILRAHHDVFVLVTDANGDALVALARDWAVLRAFGGNTTVCSSQNPPI
jgi:hypothetical protein